jgi:hypothetical protein
VYPRKERKPARGEILEDALSSGSTIDGLKFCGVIDVNPGRLRDEAQLFLLTYQDSFRLVF